MKLILDIKEENRVPFFMELLRSFDYVDVLNEIRDKGKGDLIADMAEAFNDVKLHEEGKKKLKSEKEADT